jgi:hypothetical protein
MMQFEDLYWQYECYRTSTPRAQIDSLLICTDNRMRFLFSYLGRNVGEDDSIALEPPLGRRYLDIRLPNLRRTNTVILSLYNTYTRKHNVTELF